MNERFPALPPVHHAALVGDVAALEALLARGADINARCDPRPWYGPLWRGLTPLMLAAHSADGADVGTLAWLLAHGADLGAVSAGGATAAFYAAWDGAGWVSRGSRSDRDVRLSLLLDAGLDENERLPNGRSLLSEVAGHGDAASVRMLLAYGAAVEPPWDAAHTQRARDALRQSLVGLGREDGASDDPSDDPSDDFVERIVEGLGDAPPEDAIPLHAAAEAGSLECVRLLLEAGASPQRVDAAGQTALCRAGSPEIVDALVAAGADPCLLGPPRSFEALSRKDVLDTVLTSEAPGRLEVARALLAHGAPLERAHGAATTRLYDAAFRRDADAVDWLLAQGLKPGPDSYAGRSPLHAVCWQGEMADAEINAAGERIVRALAAAGNPLAHRDAAGVSPLDDATYGDWGNPTAVRTLLALGAPPDEPGPDGVTPLMHAADEGTPETLRLLLSAGADPERQDAQGATAVDRARQHHAIWVRLLSEAAPDELDQRTATLAKVEESLRLLEGAKRRT